MSNHAGFFVTTATLARYAQIDRRTAAHRLSRVGLEPDAHVSETTGFVALWRRERMPELLSAIERSGSMPLPLAAIIADNSQ